MKRICICLLIGLMCLMSAALAQGAAEPEAALRGQTLIVRLPDSWALEELKDAGAHQGWWEDTGFSWKWHGRGAQWMQAQLSAMQQVYKPEIVYGRGRELSLSRVGDSWYALIRLYKEPQETAELDMELCLLDYSGEEGALSAQENGCVQLYLYVQPRNMNDAKAYFSRDYGAMRLQLFNALDATCAVIIEPKADAELLEDVQLTVNGAAGPLMNGYLDANGSGVYCCMIGDELVSALESGAEAGLHRPPFGEGADFEGTPYAAAYRGTGRMGIADRQGNWALEPVYDYISRPDPARCDWDTPRPFFCEQDDELLVLDGAGLQQIARLQNANVNSCNPSVFACYVPQGTQVYSARTGEPLFATDGEVVKFGPGRAQDHVRADYCGRVEGYPERLVIRNNDEGCRLADNRGNAVSGNYTSLTALSWISGRGLYLVQNEEQIDFYYMTDAGDEYTGTDGWRCGLIDENGNTIADCVYTGVRIVSREEIQLQNADGEWQRFFWLE